MLDRDSPSHPSRLASNRHHPCSETPHAGRIRGAPVLRPSSGRRHGAALAEGKEKARRGCDGLTCSWSDSRRADHRNGQRGQRRSAPLSLGRLFRGPPRVRPPDEAGAIAIALEPHRRVEHPVVQGLDGPAAPIVLAALGKRILDARLTPSPNLDPGLVRESSCLKMKTTTFHVLLDDPLVVVISSGVDLLPGIGVTIRHAAGRRCRIVVRPTWHVPSHAGRNAEAVQAVRATNPELEFTFLCPTGNSGLEI